MAKTQGRFQKGDWVIGTSVNDEKYHGYIEDIMLSEGMMKVRVIDSDNQRAIGKIVRGKIHLAKELPAEPYKSKGSLLNLIDIALSVKDKRWFQELTDELNDLDDVQENREGGNDTGILTPPNRF